MKRLVASLMLLLAAPPVFASAPITWLGHLETSEGAVNGVVAASLRVVDINGTTVSEVIEPSLVIVDGDFIVDFLVEPPIGGLPSPLFVDAVINGTPLEPTLPFASSWPAAMQAFAANDAATADEAEAVGDVQAALSIARLQSDVAVPFSVVTDFPTEFLDGDQGLSFEAGATIDFVDGVIGIKAASLPGSALGAPLATNTLAPAAITTADLQANSITAVDLSNLPLTKIAPATLTSRHFGTPGLVLYEVVETNCRTNFLNEVTNRATCNFTGPTACAAQVNGVAVQGHIKCSAADDPVCVAGVESACPNKLLGTLVFP